MTLNPVTFEARQNGIDPFVVLTIELSSKINSKSIVKGAGVNK
jgi:hypothetical protein